MRDQLKASVYMMDKAYCTQAIKQGPWENGVMLQQSRKITWREKKQRLWSLVFINLFALWEHVLKTK